MNTTTSSSLFGTQKLHTQTQENNVLKPINTKNGSTAKPIHFIPSDKYVRDEVEDILCVTDDLLHIYHTGKERQAFYKWMNGQTYMFMNKDGKAGYYCWDYERWLKKLPVID